jgi:hypothetical protein
MIADSDGNRVLEVNRSGETVWSFDGGAEPLNWPRDADKLADGNILITDSRNSLIRIINPQGDPVWEYRANYFANFYDANMTPNGTVLISDQQRKQVIEVDMGGNIVWQFRNYRSPYMPRSVIRNGSFKAVTDGMPEHWLMVTRLSEGGGRLVWDDKAPIRPAPGLEYDRTGVVLLAQRVSVLAGGIYQMSGQLRCENMRNGAFAYLQIAFIDAYGALLEDASKAPKGTFFTEDSDIYQEDFLTASAPSGATSAEIRIVLSGTGRCYARGVLFAEQ